MRTRRTIWVLPLIAAAAFGLRAFLWKPFPVVDSSPDQDGRIAGVVHVHTQHSDGRGTPEQAIAAAHAAGLDYLVITDHNAFDAKRFEGYSESCSSSSAQKSLHAGVTSLPLGCPSRRFGFQTMPRKCSRTSTPSAESP